MEWSNIVKFIDSDTRQYDKATDREGYLLRIDICHYDKFRIEVTYFKIERETDKCYVIKHPDYYGKEKFILKKARKRFAYPTFALAKESFIVRCERRMMFLKRDLNKIDFALNHVRSH